MKSITLLSACILSAAILFTSCSDAPKGDKATITDAQQTAAAAGQLLPLIQLLQKSVLRVMV